MIGTKAMSREIEVSDPISSAIGEFREELLLWIDTELARLRKQADVDDSAMTEDRATTSYAQSSRSSSRVGVRTGSPFFQSGIARQQPQTHECIVGRESPAVEESVRPPVTLPALETDPEQRPPVSNPRQRLDALARLLDHRLKQAQGTAETNGATGEGTSSGADHHIR